MHKELLRLEEEFYRACKNNESGRAYDVFWAFKAQKNASYESIWENMEEQVKEKGWYEEFMKGK